jgi:hypothetical protein
MPLAGTQNWRRYVTIATQCGLPLVLLVQAFHKGGSSSELHEEVEGVEDAAEEDMETTQGLSEGEVEDVMVGAGGEGADGPCEPMGEVDEGEHIPEILEQLQREDEEHERAMDEDSSDDEDGEEVPKNWETYKFSQLINEKPSPGSTKRMKFSSVPCTLVGELLRMQ